MEIFWNLRNFIVLLDSSDNLIIIRLTISSQSTTMMSEENKQRAPMDVDEEVKEFGNPNPIPQYGDNIMGLDDEVKVFDHPEPKPKIVDAVMGLDEPAAEVILNLISKDKDSFPLAKKIAVQSTLIKTMVEGDPEAVDIPLPAVNSNILSRVIEFMKYHIDHPMKEIEKPLKTNDLKEIVPEYYANYVDLDQELLFEVLLAANYLDLKSLLDLSCSKVATMIKGMTPEALRKIFNIVNDFTPEEEEQIRAENKWAEEN